MAAASLSVICACDKKGGTPESKHKWVDMGEVTIGTETKNLKWATCNVGADNPWDYGDYFAWGETDTYYQKGHSQDSPCSAWKDGKTGYSWGCYSLANGEANMLTKYCNSERYGDGNVLGIGGFTDTLTELEAADDAASVIWKSGWRMPTYEEWTALLDATITVGFGPMIT